MSYLELPRQPETAIYGLGEAASEIPEVGQLPWQIGVEEVKSKSERRWEGLVKLGTAAGVIIGVAGAMAVLRSAKRGKLW